jgi:hypothetical protein
MLTVRLPLGFGMTMSLAAFGLDRAGLAPVLAPEVAGAEVDAADGEGVLPAVQEASRSADPRSARMPARFTARPPPRILGLTTTRRRQYKRDIGERFLRPAAEPEPRWRSARRQGVAGLVKRSRLTVVDISAKESRC